MVTNVRTRMQIRTPIRMPLLSLRRGLGGGVSCGEEVFVSRGVGSGVVVGEAIVVFEVGVEKAVGVASEEEEDEDLVEVAHVCDAEELDITPPTFVIVNLFVNSGSTAVSANSKQYIPVGSVGGGVHMSSVPVRFTA